MGLFKQKPDPKQQMTDQCRRIRSEMRKIDRIIIKTQNEQKKTEIELKKAAKSNDKEVVRILAKSLVVSRRHVNKLFTSKAQMNSLEMQLKENVAQYRMATSIKCSTDVIKVMNSLLRIPEIHETMRELSNEMVKMGMIDEMMSDTLDSVMQTETNYDADEEEEEIETQVNSVLEEILLSELLSYNMVGNKLCNCSSGLDSKSATIAAQPTPTPQKVTDKDVPATKQNDEERLRQLLTK